MKQISTNTVKKFLKNTQKTAEITRAFTVGQSEVEYTIKTALTIDEKTRFINRVLSGCFDALGNYRPEYETPMLRATIIQMCTNLPVLSRKGEKTESGENVMDIEAMDALYVALGLENIDDAEYQMMKGEILSLSRIALDWRRNRTLVQDKGDLGEIAFDARSVLAQLSKLIESTDIASLTEFAAKLSRNTNGLDAAGFVKALHQLTKQEK